MKGNGHSRPVITSNELDDTGSSPGTVKVHGVDDTNRATAMAHRAAKLANVKLLEVQVTAEGYAGVIYVIDPEYPYEEAK